MNVLEVDIHASLGAFSLQASGVAAERVTGLLGRSGSGKTSLLQAICGLITPDEGRIVLRDRVLFDRARRINVPAHRRGIGIVFQDSRLFPHRSVEGNLRYGQRRSAASPSVSFDDAVALLELGPLLQRRPTNLSGGEQRRVALGRALLSGPELLLLDEPLTGLDQRLKAQIVPLLRRVRDELNIPIIYVAHDVTDVLQMTSQALLMDGGAIVGSGLLRDLAQRTDSFQTVHDLGFANVLTCVVRERDESEGTTQVHVQVDAQTPAADFRLPRLVAEIGAIVRIAIRPQDIALSPAPLEQVSIRNQLPGRITALSDHDGKVLVEVDLGQRVLVEITRRARSELQLAVNGVVCCLIKSTAIDVLP